MSRVVSYFSCGAASAVATKLALQSNSWRELGRTICKKEWKENGKRHLKRIFLDELPSDLGRYDAEPDISCGIICQTAELFA